MGQIVFRSLIPAAPEEVRSWIRSSGARERLWPPWMAAESYRALERLAFPGHESQVESAPDGASVLQDVVEERVGGGPAGIGSRARRPRWSAGPTLERVFAYRHRIIAGDLAARSGDSRRAPLRIVLTGASGLLGCALAAYLEAGGDEVTRLIRRDPAGAPTGPGAFPWDPARGILDARALEGASAVVHLAGENIGGGRWTRARKQRILESRVRATSLIARTMAAMDRPPQVLVAASAAGFYGDRGETPLTEEDGPGRAFFPQSVGRGKGRPSPRGTVESASRTCASAWCSPRRGGACRVFWSRSAWGSEDRWGAVSNS